MSFVRSATAACALACLTPALAADPETTTQLIPLPIYSTLPNEGSTWGFMPVFLRVHAADQRTESIYAPSVSWNEVIKSTGTFRWYHYPSDVQTLTVIASASTHVNWNNLLVWQNLPPAEGKGTDEVLVRAQRSVFARFFGIGPDTSDGAETSYTDVHLTASYRRGWNLTGEMNLGLTLAAARDLVQRDGVPGLPLSPAVFPGVPGMGGGAILSQIVDLRYDTRPLREYSDAGWYVDFGIGPVEGLAGGPSHLSTRLDARTLVPENDRFAGAVRAYWSYVSSAQTPFYYQSSLGGSNLMRGFTEGRFFDRGAWTLELEQRIRLFQSHIYGVTADWRVDPFVAVGQVYRDLTPEGMFTRVAITGGLGFRAWVRPNVVGRVDVATSGDGAKVYVELGYPF